MFLTTMTVNIHNKRYRNRQTKEDIEYPTFDFKTIAAATNNFSSDNMLGEGGFGQVYKVRKFQEDKIENFIGTYMI